jgi:hypothetical protein
LILPDQTSVIFVPVQAPAPLELEGALIGGCGPK